MKEGLTLIIAVVIIGVLLDGIRRMRLAKRNAIKMSLNSRREDQADPLDDYPSELPNGGARIAIRDNSEAEKLNSKLHKIIDPYGHGKRAAQNAPKAIDDKKPVQAEVEEIERRLEPTIGELEDDILQTEPKSSHQAPTLEQGSLFEEDGDVVAPVRVTKSAKPIAEKKQVPKQAPKIAKELIEEVFVVHVKASAGELYCGQDLLKIFQEHGLCYGNMNIFHAHEQNDPNEPVIFSLANMVMPGTFDLDKMDEFTTPGISLFLTLPLSNASGLETFNKMLELSYSITQDLGGEINDEQRNRMTRQTAEHYRERIREFSIKHHRTKA